VKVLPIQNDKGGATDVGVTTTGACAKATLPLNKKRMNREKTIMERFM
jgi:hypothetical protein